MAGKPQSSIRERSLANRLRILDAAESVFAIKGFNGTHMREIARLAGVNKYMLYYHFENKEGLFQHVLERIFDPLFQEMTTMLSQPEPLEETLPLIYDLYARLFAEKGEQLRAFMAREIAAGAPHAGKFFRTRVPELITLWSRKIDAYLSDRKPSEQERILAIYSIMIGTVSNFLMYPVFSAILDYCNCPLYGPKLKEHVIHFLTGGLDQWQRNVG